MGYFGYIVRKGDKEEAGVVENEPLPPEAPPPPSQLTPSSQLFPPAAESQQPPLEQVEVQGSPKKAKTGGTILDLVEEMSYCEDETKEKSELVFG